MAALKFSIQGMQCVICQGHVLKAVSALSGVRRPVVDLLGGTLTLELTGSATSAEDIVKAVQAAGYGATLLEGQTSKTVDGEKAAALERRMLCVRFWLSLVFAVPVCLLGFSGMFGTKIFSEELSATVQLVLVLPILWLNRAFFTRGIRAFVGGMPTMDTLVALGAGTGFIANLCNYVRLMAGVDCMVTFETPAMLLTLITLGKWLEGRAKSNAASAIVELRKLAPRKAVVRRNDGEVEIDVEELRVGDVCIVRPGGVIPADGVVLKGASSIDQSAVTGEWMPAEKGVGDNVIGATINQSGYLEIRVTAVGVDTLFEKIIGLVAEAGATKAPIARLADKVCAVFVPCVLCIALVTFAAWLLAGGGVSAALGHAIAVLVISCPCALGLATPVAILVGTGVGARRGILYKNATVIEALSHVDTLVLDKTGTITSGKPAVIAVTPSDGYDEEGILALAASLEAQSEHPLARAICAEAASRGIELTSVTGFSAVQGRGIVGKIRGKLYGCGNRKMLEDADIDVETDDSSHPDATALWLFSQGEVIGQIWLADKVRDEAPEALGALNKLGVSVAMLTGDRRSVAEGMAKRLKIGDYCGEMLPADKAEWIKAHEANGYHCAMMGDGVNDAPALAAASVGIAVGEGTDVALETAQVILVNSNMTTAVEALKLSRAVMRKIRQNLCWAFCYNLVAIPMAAGVFAWLGISVPPWFCAALMASSSLIVVTNSLRIGSGESKIERKIAE